MRNDVGCTLWDRRWQPPPTIPEPMREHLARLMRLSDMRCGGSPGHHAEEIYAGRLQQNLQNKRVGDPSATSLDCKRFQLEARCLLFLDANVIGRDSHVKPAETHDLERISRGRGVKAAYRPFKPGGGGSSPSGPSCDCAATEDC